MQSIEYLRKLTLAIARTSGVGPRAFQELLSAAGGIERVEDYLQSLSAQYNSGIKAKIARSMDTDWELALAKTGTDFVCVWEEEYPKLLADIYDPPPVLFYKGDIKPLNCLTTLAVVGTRAVDKYGENAIRDILANLSTGPVSIVSGLAFGADAYAHSIALDLGIHTAAVLAGPASVPSPQANYHLYKRILAAGGCIVSEVYPDEKPLAPGMFASRNRLVAGISAGTLVVQAGNKSGALITANLAFDFGRQVFAVPGSMHMPLSEGCNNLIKNQKAKLIMSAADILEDIFLLPAAAKDGTLAQDRAAELTPAQRTLYELLVGNPAYIEELCAKVDIAPETALSLLSMLELQDLIYKDAAGRYFTK